MWYKYLITVILFYLFAVLQNSFFVHFSMLGDAPNLVFILFFLLIFFSAKNKPVFGWEEIFYAVMAGLLLDLFSYTFFGASIILMLLIVFFVKKAQNFLQEKKNDKFPLIYFLPLFLISLMAYNLLFKIPPNFWSFATEIIFNALAACIAFFSYKKFLASSIDNRQLKLFMK